MTPTDLKTYIGIRILKKFPICAVTSIFILGFAASGYVNGDTLSNEKPLKKEDAIKPVKSWALYDANCAVCHGSSEIGTSAAAIAAAISSNKGGMSFLKTLTAGQIAALADGQ